MRSENKIRRSAQRRIGRQRLNFKNIQRGAADLTRVQRVSQRVFIDQAAARTIDHAHAAFCFCQSRRIDNVTRFFRERRVQRDEISAREQVIELIDKFDLQSARARRRQIRIVRNNAHPERDGAAAQFTADPAHADDAERLVIKLDAFEIFSVPISAAQSRIRSGNFSRHTEQE